MHACGIVHADLKPDNVLMTRPTGALLHSCSVALMQRILDSIDAWYILSWHHQAAAALEVHARHRGCRQWLGCYHAAGGAGVGVKLADFGSCFAAAGVDTARLSFELQTLSYRAPEASAAVSDCAHVIVARLQLPVVRSSAFLKLATLQGGA